MQPTKKKHPQAWRIDSKKSEDFELQVDESITYNGQRACLFKCTATDSTPKGEMIQTMGGFEYRQKRLCFSAKVKTHEILGKANLFITLLNSEPALLLPGEVTGEPLSGSNDWTELKIVVDVPEMTRYINFGIMISGGAGALWIADLSVSMVDLNTPLTEIEDPGERLKRPTNFDLAPDPSDSEKPLAWGFHTSPASASNLFEGGLRQEDSSAVLWIKSDAELTPLQGEKSNNSATYTHCFSSFQWRNKRVRFSADIKCKDVGDWCGLMMWIHDLPGKTLAFATMYSDGGLSGTQDWQKCSLVLDVTEVAYTITIGATLHGNGQVSFSNISFAEADADEVPTDRGSRPRNLSFADCVDA